MLIQTMKDWSRHQATFALAKQWQKMVHVGRVSDKTRNGKVHTKSMERTCIVTDQKRES